MKLLDRVKKLLDRVKYGIPAGITASLVAVSPALADSGAQAAVETAFTNAANEIKQIVLAVAGAAISILVVMYAFRWGKKIFNRVAS